MICFPPIQKLGTLQQVINTKASICKHFQVMFQQNIQFHYDGIKRNENLQYNTACIVGIYDIFIQCIENNPYVRDFTNYPKNTLKYKSTYRDSITQEQMTKIYRLCGSNYPNIEILPNIKVIPIDESEDLGFTIDIQMDEIEILLNDIKAYITYNKRNQLLKYIAYVLFQPIKVTKVFD